MIATEGVFKKKELDLNEMVENIANSFTLRVEHTGGKVYTDIEAIDWLSMWMRFISRM